MELKVKGQRLGKRAPVIDRRTLRFATYMKKGVSVPPAAPAEESWIMRVPSWPMMLNDALGDCVIAAMGHMIQQWTYFATGGAGSVVLPDSVIERGYENVGGYVPGDPSTDNGCNMLDALKYWRKKGLGGHKILGFVAVDPRNLEEVKKAVWLFGNSFVGLALPISAQPQAAWTVPLGGPVGTGGSPGGWGGHCVPIMASSPMSHTSVTWGDKLKMSHNFFADYCDEAYAVLSQEWLDVTGHAPNNFDLAALKADLAAL